MQRVFFFGKRHAFYGFSKRHDGLRVIWIRYQRIYLYPPAGKIEIFAR